MSKGVRFLTFMFFLIFIASLRRIQTLSIHFKQCALCVKTANLYFTVRGTYFV